jgi:Ca2+-binding RTX toxin-like protein
MTMIVKRSVRVTIVLTLVLLVAIGVTAVINDATSPKRVQAVGDVNIVWGVPDGQPIFFLTDVKPGDTVTRTVAVENNASVDRPISLRGIKTSETKDLSGILEIVISSNGIDLYGGSKGLRTVADFFTDSADPEGIPLTTVPAGTSIPYLVTVIFPSSAGNEYQEAQLVFDIIFGLATSIPEECRFIQFTGEPIYGTAGNDRIYGTLKNDLIFALEGNDRVLSHGGDDCIIGGPGNDELRGETGKDVIFGNEGDDRVIGAQGDDLLFGNEGHDLIRGEQGKDRIYAGKGNDKVYGGDNDDIIYAEDGNDTVYGEGGNDLIYGGPGDDTIDGGFGGDVIYGEDGNDTLFGKDGNDQLTGGDGTDSANGSWGTDTCVAESQSACEL